MYRRAETTSASSTRPRRSIGTGSVSGSIIRACQSDTSSSPASTTAGSLHADGCPPAPQTRTCTLRRSRAASGAAGQGTSTESGESKRTEAASATRTSYAAWRHPSGAPSTRQDSRGARSPIPSAVRWCSKRTAVTRNMSAAGGAAVSSTAVEGETIMGVTLPQNRLQVSASRSCPRLVAAQAGGGPDPGPQCRQVAVQGAVGPGLHEQVAQGGGLDGSGDQRSAGGIGGELAQQRVLRSAADEVDDLHRPAGQPLGLLDRSGEGGGEAVEDAADHHLGRGVGDRLAGVPAGPDDAD